MSSTGERAEGSRASAADEHRTALRLADEAEELISEVLAPGRWPTRDTVDRFLKDDRLERVLALYASAMKLDPEDPTLPWNLASTLSRLGLNDLALAFVERAVRVGTSVDPEEWETPGTYLAWADVAIEAGQYEVALVALANAVGVSDGDLDVQRSVRRLHQVIKEKKHTDAPAQDLVEKLRLVVG